MTKFTDEGYSFHTALFMKQISCSEYKKIKNTIFSHAHTEKYRAYSKNRCTLSEQYKAIGVIIRLYDNAPYPPHMELRVNPRFICGDHDYIGIFQLTTGNIEMVKNKIDEILFSICCSFRFDDMILSRIDLCVNIELDDAVLTDLYLKRMRKCFLPIGFDRIYFPNDEKGAKEKNKHSFRAGNQKLDFTVYDKIFQMKEERLLQDDRIYPTALIRFEVSLKRPRIRQLTKRYFGDAIVSNTDLLWRFGLQSRSILTECVRAFFPNGYYLTYQKAKDVILHAPVKAKTRIRMLALLMETSYSENLNNAVEKLQKKFTLKKSQVKVVLNTFESINLNPVTLPNKSVYYVGIQGIRQLFEAAENAVDD